MMDGIQARTRYWDDAATKYDRDFTGTLIGQTRRRSVWRDLERAFRHGQRVLELNCGTGIDAIHLAARGIEVLACDISPRMIQIARQGAAASSLQERVDWRVLPTEDLQSLQSQSPFDGAFSNFSGLNCVEDLPAAARNLARLLKPGAPLLICVIGHFVPWEIAWFLAHGKPVKAFRRVLDNGGLSDAGDLKIQRPSVRKMARIFAPDFELRGWRGVGIAVPPSYMERWARRFPGILKLLAVVDDRIDRLPLFRNLGDCILLEFSRRETNSSSSMAP
ncbi:MAG: class I SAM-dependent methyltransferase [Bryobacteraceae bacterium]|jgi:ubiquinone/menaquinone biosynthesis C-methylase UbiE